MQKVCRTQKLWRSSKDVMRQRHQRAVNALRLSLEGKTQLEQAEAIVAAQGRFPGSSPVAIARTFTRHTNTEKNQKTQKQQQTLAEYEEAFGKSRVAHMTRLLPILKQQSWCDVPSEGLALLELRTTSTQAKATTLCGALTAAGGPLSSKLEHMWEDLHHTIEEGLEHVPEPAGVRTRTSPQCREAGVCLCCAGGKLLQQLRREFLAHMKASFTTQKSRMQLGSGLAVVRLLERGSTHPQRLEQGGKQAAALTLHVSLMYWSPYRPTFLVVTERPGVVDDQLLVQVCRCCKEGRPFSGGRPNLLVWKTSAPEGGQHPELSHHTLSCNRHVYAI